MDHLDIDHRLLGRPSQFSGGEEAWSDWSFQTRAYFSTLDATLDELMEASEGRVQPLLLTALTAEQKSVSRKTYFVLAMLLKGPALLILKRCERSNGLECWRMLCARYEGVTSNRLHVMLQGILRPQMFPSETLGFETALQNWELLISKWETMSEDLLNESVKRQILLEQAPPVIRVQLTLQGHTSYDALRTAVLGYLVNARDWSSGQPASSGTSMEVDALTMKGKKGKKGMGKGDKNGFIKGKDPETRSCYHCGKKGHLSRDCWNKNEYEKKDFNKDFNKDFYKGKKGKGKEGKGHVSYMSDAVVHEVNSNCSSSPQFLAAPSAPSSVAAVYSNLEAIYEGDWILLTMQESKPSLGLCAVTVKAEFSQKEGFLLIDSGAACHVCPKSWIPEGSQERSYDRVLRTANGTALKYYGNVSMQLALPGVKGFGSVVFEVTDVHCAILSVSQLLKGGHKIEFEKDRAFFHHVSGVRLPLLARNGLYFLRTEVRSLEMITETARWVAPLVEDVETEHRAIPGQPLGQPEAMALDHEDEPPRPLGLARGLPVPLLPSAEEVARHELTHMPAQPWCDACIRGRGRDAAHYDKKNAMRDEITPVIEMDYFFVGDEITGVSALVANDRASGSLYSTVVTEKGPKCTFALSSCISWLRELGLPALYPPVGWRTRLDRLRERRSGEDAREQCQHGQHRLPSFSSRLPPVEWWSRARSWLGSWICPRLP